MTIPPPSVLVQGDRLLLASKHPIVTGQQHLPPLAHNTQNRQQVDRLNWIKQEIIPNNNAPTTSSVAIEENPDDQPESTANSSFSQVFTQAVLKKEIKEQFVKKSQGRSRRKKSDGPPKPRTRNPETWKRNKLRMARLRGEEYVSKSVAGLCEVTGKQIFTQQSRKARTMKPPCKPHRVSIYQCKKFTEEMRRNIFDNFWQNMDWEQRKKHVCDHVEVEPVKTTCAKDEKQQRRFVNVKYFLDIDDKPQMVCKEMFHGTFGINHHSTHYWLINLNKIEMDKTPAQGKSVCLAKLVDGAGKPKQRRMKKRDRIRLGIEEPVKKGRPSNKSDPNETSTESNDAGKSSEAKNQSMTKLSESEQSLRRYSKQQEEIGPPCNCRSSMAFTKDCANFTDEIRANIFNNFWNFMNFDGRKSFFLEHVSVIEPYGEKRGVLEYFLTMDGVRYPVCQRLFLSTLGIGRYSCRYWLTLVGHLPQVEYRPRETKTRNESKDTGSPSKEEIDLRKQNPMGPRCNCYSQKINKRRCQKFTENIRKKIHKLFWCTFNVSERKAFLQNYVEVGSVKTHRPNCLDPERKQYSVQYFLPLGSERLIVCYTLFHRTLGFTKSSLRKRLMNVGVFKPTKTKIDFIAIDNSTDTDWLMNEDEQVDSNELYPEISMESGSDLELDDEAEDVKPNVKLESFSDTDSEPQSKPQPKRFKRTKTVCDYLSELINQISRPVLKLKELNLADFSHLSNYSDIQQQFADYKNRETVYQVDDEDESDEDEDEDESGDDNIDDGASDNNDKIVEIASVDVNHIKKEINYDE